MQDLYVLFPVSGVKTRVFIPPLVAFVVSSLTSMADVSGAFVLLPFQLSVLGFTSVAISSTNFVYNIIAIPSGVYRYFRKAGWPGPLSWVVILGTCLVYLSATNLRILYLPDPVRLNCASAWCSSISARDSCMK